MIPRALLEKLYTEESASMQEIARKLNVSVHKVSYWMSHHGIQRRSISEAIYRKHNRNGDPFIYCPPKTATEAKLFGLGIGLYWGEGTKANQHSVRLGNTDPTLMKTFIVFLIKFFRIRKGDLRFGLQVFSDLNPQVAQKYWIEMLGAGKQQFYKTMITPSISRGTYRRKNQYGVLTVYYNNKKLRDLLVSLLPG